jgi:hypothetical protein
MNNKFVAFSTIKNSGIYKNYNNICFFISISDILQNYNISISPPEGVSINMHPPFLSPRSLIKLTKFKGHNGEFFDTDKHIDKDLIKLLNYLNIVIFIYPYCPKFKAINPEFYMKIPVYQNKCKLIIPLVCFDNTHFEPIVDTKISIIEDISAKNIYNNKYILCKINKK